MRCGPRQNRSKILEVEHWGTRRGSCSTHSSLGTFGPALPRIWSIHVVTHLVDGLNLMVDRGPNWLFVKLRPRRNWLDELPQIADELWSIASRHFIYRLVLELEELKSLPPGLMEQLVLL